VPGDMGAPAVPIAGRAPGAPAAEGP
jgi:hypothetical protein